jgi:hypothetical protein
MVIFHGRRKTAVPSARPSIKASSRTCRRPRHHLTNNPRPSGVVRRSETAERQTNHFIETTLIWIAIQIN